MAKHDYAPLDAAILAALSVDKPLKLARLPGAVDAEAYKLEDAERVGWVVRTPASRFVDRRLQALRKAGRIWYQRQPEGWVLSEA